MSTLKTPASPRPPKPRRESHEYIEYEKYIDGQVQRTRKNVKLVDLASAMVVLVVALLGFFLTAAFLEHWILPGGLGTIGRVAMFVVLLAGLGHYAWHTLWPLLSRPINPEYAAVAIEREHPSLKNSLINFLLFRSEKGKMPPAVFDALEEQAAQRLAQSPIDDAVDRTPLVRWGYVLLGILILGVVYSLASPKSTFDTARRVLMPWSQIATPSRVRITDITPGNVEIIQGDSLEVRAHIRGLVDGEVVHLSYDTADRQHVEQLIPMSPIDEIGNYSTKLPQGEGHAGIQQNLTYRIVAGDGRSIDYQVTALRAPSIRVREVRYEYPDYTGIEDRTATDRGDIRAIEGTTVTIVAEANGPIESAHLDMEADGTQDIRMKVEGNVATATIELMLPKERQTPKLSTYQLNMISTEGVANRKPPQHVLEILPDVAPVVEVLEPAERSREVQLNETVVFRVQASDTDYLLSQVKLHFAKMPDDKLVVTPSLLEPSRPGVDKLDGRWEFTASEYDLKAGDVVEYWAEARDNCQPNANITITERKELVIVAPAEGQQNPDQQRQQGKGKGQQQNQPGQGGEGKPDPNQQGEGGNQGGKGQPDKSQPNQTQQGERGADQQPGEGGAGANDQQQPGGQGANDQPQQGAGGQGTEQQNPSEQQPGEGQGTEQQEGAGSQQQQGPGAQGAGPQNNQQQQEGTGGGQNSQPPAGGEPRQGEQRPGEPGGGAGTDAHGNPDGQQQPGGGRGAPGPNDRRPIANDGSQDADALQKMNDHLTQEEQQNATRRDAKPGEAGDQQPRDASEGQGTNPEGGQPQEGQPQGTQPKEGQPQQGTPQEGQPQGAQPSGEKPSEAQGAKPQGSQSQNKQGANPEGKQPPQNTGDDPLKEFEQEGEAPPEGQRMENTAQPDGAQPRNQEGQGAKTQGGSRENEQGSDQQPREGSQSGGEKQGRQGNSGAGDEKNPEAPAEAQEDADPRTKRPDAGQTDQSNSTEPQSPGHGKKESDSRGETGGDRTGGGEQGGDQSANREGTGSNGQNQAADQGAGRSQDQGPGDTGSEAGDAEKAGRETGQSGNQAGKGSQQRQGEGNKTGGQQGDKSAQSKEEGEAEEGTEQPGEQQGKPGDKPGEQGEQPGEEGNEPAEKGQPPREPGDKRGERGKEPGGKSPPEGEPGDRRQSSGDNSPNNQKYDLAEADKANLEYARKQTDLVLDTLEKQLKENKVDQELLDKLGWSEDDLRKFVDRWQSLRRKAAQNTPEGEAAKVELDNRLRKLGPKRGNVEGETKRTEDTLRDLGEGYQSEVPLKFRDKVKRYTEGISK